MKKTTVYLLLEDESGLIESEIILLANARKTAMISSGAFEGLAEGDTYGDLRTKYHAIGTGVTRYKDGVERWYLPFHTHPDIIAPDPLSARVLTKDEILGFGWDVEEVEV
tara:strand:- start:27 stop:356 length:330 start_codon:yes stop_codon:yes gene_type:complete